MAAPNISEIATTTLEKRSGKIADNVTKNNATLLKLQERAEEPIDGGRLIYEELSFQQNGNGQFYSGYDTLNVSAQEVLSAAQFDWKQYAVPVVMSGLEELQNSGEAAVHNLLAKRIMVAESTMANDIATSILGDGTGTGGKAITGFGAMIPTNPLTGTYGGINRALYAFWQPQLVDPASTPTASTIQAVMNELWAKTVRGTDHTDLIISGTTLWLTFLASLQANQRFENPKLAEAGFTTVKYMGADVVLDGGVGGAMTATNMLFLNTKYIHWRPHKRRNFVPIGKKRAAVNQDASVEVIGFAGNLTASNSALQGLLKGD